MKNESRKTRKPKGIHKAGMRGGRDQKLQETCKWITGKERACGMKRFLHSVWVLSNGCRYLYSFAIQQTTTSPCTRSEQSWQGRWNSKVRESKRNSSCSEVSPNICGECCRSCFVLHTLIFWLLGWLPAPKHGIHPPSSWRPAFYSFFLLSSPSLILQLYGINMLAEGRHEP